MSIERYDIDWEQDYYPHPDGRWCFAEEAIEAIATKDAEIARLTAQLDRLAAEVKAWRRSWVMIDSQIRDAVASSDSLRSLKRAQLAVDHNNDLGGAK